MKSTKFLILFSCLITFLSAQSIDQQIQKSYTSLANKELEEKKLSRQLEEIAKSLKKEESELIKTDKNISLLNQKISEQQKTVVTTKNELSSIDKQNKELMKTRDELEKNMTDMIAQEFSYMLVVDQGYVENQDAIITDELLKVMSNQTNEKLQEYQKEFLLAENKIEEGNQKIGNIQKSITDLEEQKTELSKLKTSKTKIIEDIEKEKSVYLKKLQTLQAEKAELKKTLESLKIIEEESKVAVTPPPATTPPSVPLTTDEKIRQLGSSYQSSKVKKYTGAKTISPLDKYTVVQKFGDFVDPVYNIKIFNESVVLRSTKNNDEVKNVLDGKVIFAKSTQLLKNVVIVENADGIHTIYAHLSRIAPTIKVGSKIKKGYVIGRVDKDLTFEVTQKNYHINPMELITR